MQLQSLLTGGSLLIEAPTHRSGLGSTWTGVRMPVQPWFFGSSVNSRQQRFYFRTSKGCFSLSLSSPPPTSRDVWKQNQGCPGIFCFFVVFFAQIIIIKKKKLKLLSLSLDRSQDRGEGLESGGNKHAFYDYQILDETVPPADTELHSSPIHSTAGKAARSR